MATKKIRYYVEKSGSRGSVRRFWQPSKALRAAGFLPQRLPDDEVKAWARAEELNRSIDEWRRGERPVATADGGAPARFKKPNSWAWLIATFEGSRRFRDLAPATQRNYRSYFRLLEIWGGEESVAAINSAPRIDMLYEELLKVSHSRANACIRVVRLLLAFARRKGIITTNAASKPQLKQLPPRVVIWTDDEVAAGVAAADALGFFSIGDAILIAHNMAQREGDILALPIAQRVTARALQANGTFAEERRVRIVQSKTGARVDIPELPVLSERLDAITERNKAKSTPSLFLVVSEATGKPYKQDYFRHTFALVRRVAISGDVYLDLPPCPSLMGKWFSDLRDTAVTVLSDAGCTIPEICAVSGHSLDTATSILKHYWSATSHQAASAMGKVRRLREAQAAERLATAKLDGR